MDELIHVHVHPSEFDVKKTWNSAIQCLHLLRFCYLVDHIQGSRAKAFSQFFLAFQCVCQWFQMCPDGFSDFLFGVKKRRCFKMGFEKLGLLHVPPETVDEFLILERMLFFGLMSAKDASIHGTVKRWACWTWRSLILLSHFVHWCIDIHSNMVPDPLTSSLYHQNYMFIMFSLGNSSKSQSMAIQNIQTSIHYQHP